MAQQQPLSTGLEPSKEAVKLRKDFVPTFHIESYPAIDPPTKSDLSGRYVLISGASKGIGKSTALAFAEAGAAGIAIGARSSLSAVEGEIHQAAEKAGKPKPQVLKLSLDVEDAKSVDGAAQSVSSTFSQLDILINNAGYLAVAKRVAESDPDEWWKTWTVNIRGVYLLTRALLPQMLKSNHPCKQVINITSAGAHHTVPGMSAYQTTKFALLRFSEFLSVEYADQGLVSYAVHPGGVMTDLAANMPDDWHGILNNTPDLGGDTLVWLTQESRQWLRGRYVNVQWDMPEFLAKKEEIIEKDLLKMRMVVQ